MIRKQKQPEIHGYLNYHNSVSVSHSVMFNTLQPQGLWPARILCPWNSLGKNTEVNCHSLLQRVFPTQGSEPGSQADSFLFELQGSPLQQYSELKRVFKIKDQKQTYRGPQILRGDVNAYSIRYLKVDTSEDKRDTIIATYHNCNQSCSTLYNPTDCGPPGFSVHGVIQARILEWIAIPFSRRSS